VAFFVAARFRHWRFLSRHRISGGVMDPAVPRAIRQAGPRTLAIEWSDGKETRYDVRELRLACPCAGCVDEATGEKRLRAETVPEDVRPRTISNVGRYALKIVWSDGHDTGIYTYDRLRKIAGA